MKKSLLVFVDSQAHLLKAESIIYKEFEIYDVTIVTSSSELKILINPAFKSVLVSSLLSTLLFIITKYRKTDILLAARVDSLYFQVMFKFIKFEKLATFDEGLFSAMKSSRYNTEKAFSFSGQTKYYLFHKLFSFPIPATIILSQSIMHFSWLAKQSFKNTALKKSKIIEMGPLLNKSDIKTVMIGQPWHFMGATKLKDIFDKINNANVDLYILHPRENYPLLKKYISPSIRVLRLVSPIESFLSILCNSEKIDLVTVASSAVFHIDRREFNLKIIKANSGNDLFEAIQENFIEQCKLKNIIFEEI